MRHFPKPFFRPKKDRWYVQLDGKQINLGPDRDVAFDRYHALMADRRQRARPAPPSPASDHALVVTVLDEFLDWLAKRVEEGTKATRTYDWYEQYLNSFGSFATDSLPRRQDLTVDVLEPIHVYQWVDAQPGWKTSRRGAMVAVQRAFNWGGQSRPLEGLGGRSPLASIEKPPQGRREQLVTPEEFARVARPRKRPGVQRPPVALLGNRCPAPRTLHRRDEVRGLRKRTLGFPHQESKGKKVQRVIYLTDRALEITRRLMHKHPDGPMLRNTDGVPWCTSSVSRRFQRIRDKVGIKYSLVRHSVTRFAPSH